MRPVPVSGPANSTHAALPSFGFAQTVRFELTAIVPVNFARALSTLCPWLIVDGSSTNTEVVIVFASHTFRRPLLFSTTRPLFPAAPRPLPPNTV